LKGLNTRLLGEILKLIGWRSLNTHWLERCKILITWRDE